MLAELAAANASCPHRRGGKKFADRRCVNPRPRGPYDVRRNATADSEASLACLRGRHLHRTSHALPNKALCNPCPVPPDSQREPLTQAQRKAQSARGLVSAAVELIAEHGWDKSSNAEISRRAGYSATMVNARYGSRDGLLRALLEDYGARFEFAGPPRDSGLEELLERIEILRRQVTSDPVTLRAFLMLCFEAVGPSATHRAWIEDWFADYVEGLTRIIKRGQQDGSIRRDIDARREAQFFLDAGTGICYSWMLSAGERADSQLVELRRRIETLLSTR